jgi:hypothetical protein
MILIVAGNDPPLIDERAATRGRGATGSEQSAIEKIAGGRLLRACRGAYRGGGKNET